jgi:transposase
LGDAAKIRASDPRQQKHDRRDATLILKLPGNRFMRMLLVEAAQIAVRYDPQMRTEYLHRCHKKAKGVAKVARQGN